MQQEDPSLQISIQTLCTGVFARNKSEKNMYRLLTEHEVKMAGDWPGSHFCKLMDKDKVEVHKQAKGKGGQYPDSLTEKAWSREHFICTCINNTFFLRETVCSKQYYNKEY